MSKPRRKVTAYAAGSAVGSLRNQVEDAIGLLALLNTAAVHSDTGNNHGVVHIDSDAFSSATRHMREALYSAHIAAEEFLADYT